VKFLSIDKNFINNVKTKNINKFNSLLIKKQEHRLVIMFLTISKICIN